MERGGEVIHESFDYDAVNLIEAAMRFIEEKQPYKIESILGRPVNMIAYHEETLDYKNY